jgi:hypothetical protein
MILLPDVILNIGGVENRLSLQDPYTLNGKIITNISIDYSQENCYATNYFGQRMCTTINHHSTIQIRNEENYNIEISGNILAQIICDKLINFFSEMNREVVEIGESPRYWWTIQLGYGIDNYIRDLGRQCEKIQNSYISYSIYGRNFIDNCKERLRNQGRLSYTRMVNDNQDWYYSPTLSTSHYSHAEGYTTRVNPYTYAAYQPAFINYGVAVSSESSKQKKYIHDFDYKPTYIKNYMPDEDKSSTLLLGAEIEVAGNDKILDKEEVVKKCIQIMNGSDDDTEDLIYSTSDSTVQIELDTMPCTLDFHKQRMNYKELFKYLDELGYKGHDCKNAGLHIHADRSYLGNTELKQQLVITKILYILEKFNDEICVIARRNHDYSKFVGKEEVKKTLHKLYSKYEDSGKKVALNLKHKDTIEFRCFRSTLRYETFILTLEFVKDIIDYAKSVNIEDIELIQWTDLMNTFSDELKEYYNDRLEKEKKKKEEEKKNSITFGSGSLHFTDASGERFSLGDVDSLSLDTVTTTFADTIDSVFSCNRLRSLSSSLGTCSATFETSSSSMNFLSNLLRETSNSAIEQLETRIENLSEVESKKKEIKDLKKRIKNSRSYMEKAHLNTELCRAQKELKKLKRIAS